MNPDPHRIHEDPAVAVSSSEGTERGAPSSPAPPSPAPPPLTLVGREVSGQHRWRLIERVSRGGFGAVYLAEPVVPSPDLPDRAAIKLINAPWIDNPSSALKRELASLKALRHDRIPRLHDWNFSQSPVFVAMDYYQQGSLQDAMGMLGPVDDFTAWRLLDDLLRALNAAHQAGILHLDIKPANILIDQDGGFVLTDFGLSQATLISQNIIPPGLGTRGYQAPEQRHRDGDAIDARTDLWSLGATVWAMYAGIDLSMKEELVGNPVEGHPWSLPLLSSFRPDCGAALERVVMELVHADQSMRPGGAAEVLAAVARATAGLASSDSVGKLRRAYPATSPEARAVVEALVDPLWSAVCRAPRFDRPMVRYEDGEHLCREGDSSFLTWVLLSGAVDVEFAGRSVATIDREGEFLGEIATLTGEPRTAGLRARGTVWAIMFNAAELERFLTLNPTVGLRLVKSMAQRLQREARLRDGG